ncbi:SDR family oxidoreductase [Amycolatopsis acidicola]|uniref:SDR family oxidoreductase n=1 Tax=Amycolatopsis acidicola TaxID=2596893 RepID=A0A5N0VJK2_9PSEU|nr:SDR family oxidoreductase [Amycolatopsis acidicola]KAA9166499.1 SDR family oxidoreductase [Amycolatopsis acidicola]
MELAGRTALVTGASQGIGESIALALARRGMRVYAGVRSEPDRLRLNGAGGTITPVRLDICEQDDIDAVRKRLEAETGDAGLDVLVNNAGVFGLAPVEHVCLDDLRYLFEVNVLGQIAVIQATLPLLRKAGGRIVNIGSDAAKFTLPIVGPYAASKAAFEAIGVALRREVGAQGVTVVAVQPGTVKTRLWDRITENPGERAWPSHPSYQDFLAGVAAVADRGRSAGRSPESVAEAIVRLLTLRRPPARHRVGWDARLRGLTIALLPTRVIDGFLARRLAPAGSRG